MASEVCHLFYCVNREGNRTYVLNTKGPLYHADVVYIR